MTSSGGGSLQLFGGEVHAPVRLGRHAAIAGSGAVGDLTVDGGSLIPGFEDPVMEVRGDLAMVGGTRFTVTERSGHHLRVTGRVHLDGVLLSLADDGRPIGDGNDAVAAPLRRGARPRVVVEDASSREGTTAVARARIEPPSSDPVHFRLGTIGGSATFRDSDANHQSFASVAHVGAVDPDPPPRRPVWRAPGDDRRGPLARRAVRHRVAHRRHHHHRGRDAGASRPHARLPDGGR